MKLSKPPVPIDKGDVPVRAHTITDSRYPSAYYSSYDVRRPATSDGNINGGPNGRSKFRGSILGAASDALGIKFGRRRPSVRQPTVTAVLSDVIEISAARADAEDEERDRLRKMAAEAIGLDPNMTAADSHSRASASATDDDDDLHDDAPHDATFRPADVHRRMAYTRTSTEPKSPNGRRSPHGSSLSVAIPVPLQSQTAQKPPPGRRYRSGSVAGKGHSPSNSMTIAPIPAFPTTVAALTSFRETAGMYPKYYPPSSLRIFALSRNWKNRYLLLSKPATLVTKGRTPAVSYLHLFKSSAADEKELERLEINEDSVVFVAEEEVGGKRHVIKVGGADVGAMRKEYTHEEGGHIMWLLQIADPSDAQKWITTIKHAILGQRTVRAGLIPPLQLGSNEPRGDMDVMMSIRAQTLPTAATSPTSTTFRHGSSPPTDAYASSVSSQSVTSQGAPPKPPGSPTSAVSALKGLFSVAAGRPRSGSRASRATSVSSERNGDKDDDSFASRGILSMLRAGTPDNQSVHTVQSARGSAPLPFGGPPGTAALDRRIERRIIQDPVRSTAWPASASSTTVVPAKDRATKGLSTGAMSLQPPPRKRWTASGVGDGPPVEEEGTKTPTRAESARRMSIGHGEGDSLVEFQFGTPEQRPRAPSLQSVSTLASAEPARSSTSTKRSSRVSARRWSRQGLLPSRSMPPSDPPPAVPHPYAAQNGNGSAQSSKRSVVSSLPAFSKRASVGSVNSQSTTYSPPPSVVTGPVTPRPPASHRMSMPPPRPAPTTALPPAPGSAPVEPPSPESQPSPEESPGASVKATFRSAAHRTFRLSMGAPKPPPQSTLPPRPDEPEYHPPAPAPAASAPFTPTHRRASSGSAITGSQLSTIPASPSASPITSPKTITSPFPPPAGPLPPTPAEPAALTPAPAKRMSSLSERLRRLSSPQPSATQAHAQSRARAFTQGAHLAQPSPPPTPIAEKITLFQNDPSFLQMHTPATPAATLPAFLMREAPPPPTNDQTNGMTPLFPPPRRGSKQLLEVEIERLRRRTPSPATPPQPQTPTPPPPASSSSRPSTPRVGHKLSLSIVAESAPVLSHLSLSRPGSAQSHRSEHSDNFLEIEWESPRSDAPQNPFPPDHFSPDNIPPEAGHALSSSRTGSVISLGAAMAL